MKLELTNLRVWSKLSEKKVSMPDKIKIYEKLGGAYRFAYNEDEQVFNKLTELIKYAIKERSEERRVGKRSRMEEVRKRREQNKRKIM